MAIYYRCDKEYFVDEVGLSDIPEGDWFCPTCVVTLESSKAKGKKAPAAKSAAAKKSAVKEEPVATARSTRSRK